MSPPFTIALLSTLILFFIMDFSRITNSQLWDILPKLNLLFGTCTSAFILACFAGVTERPFDITLPPENAITAPNIGVLLIFLLTALYILKFDELKEGLDNKVLNILAFMTLTATLGAFFLPTFLMYIPVVHENPTSDSIVRGVVVTCSCYLQNPETYAQCINGLIADCNSIMCARPGDVICNNRFQWVCGDDNKLYVTTCERGCKPDRTGCVEPPIQIPLNRQCFDGSKCVTNIVYVCDDGLWTPYKECPAGCNYAGTNCILEPVIIPERIGS